MSAKRRIISCVVLLLIMFLATYQLQVLGSIQSGTKISTSGMIMPSPPLPPNIVWQSNFECGDFSEWTQGGGGQYYENLPQTDCIVDGSNPHSGSYSFRAVVHYKVGTADGAKVFRWAIDEKEFWFQTFIWVDNDAKNALSIGTNNIVQTKPDRTGANCLINIEIWGADHDPPYQLVLWSATAGISLSGHTVQNVPAVPLVMKFEQWVNITHHMRVDNTNGIYEAWMDGVQMWDYHNIDTMEDGTSATETAHVAVSNYPHPTENYPQGNPDIDIWFDDIKVSTTPF